MGWFNDQVRKFKNRNNRSAAGAYEQPLQGGGASGRRGFGPLDPDEAWDARVGTEADQYGYYEEEQQFGRGRNTEYGGGSYNMNLAATPGATSRGFDDEERGRASSRPGDRNPFDDDAESSLRGVSPRPIDTDAPRQQQQQKKTKTAERDSADSSPTERRSIFRENV